MIFLLSLLLLSSCASLVEDPSMPSTDANYPSAIGEVNNDKFVGLKIINIKPGDNISSLKFKVQGFGEGVIKVDSESCGIRKSLFYKKSQLVDVGLDFVPLKSCVLSFLVSPQFKEQENSPIRVESFLGHLAIKVIKTPTDWSGDSIKITSSDLNRYFKFWYGGFGKARVIASGCGISYDEKVDLRSGYVDLKFGDVIENRKKTCILSGRIVGDTYRYMEFDILISQYDEKFVPLASPAVYVDKKNGHCFEAERSVSIIATKKTYSVSNTACFNQADYVYFLTVKGRSMVAKMNGGKWEIFK